MGDPRSAAFVLKEIYSEAFVLGFVLVLWLVELRAFVLVLVLVELRLPARLTVTLAAWLTRELLELLTSLLPREVFAKCFESAAASGFS